MSGLDPNGAGVLVVGGGSSLPTAAARTTTYDFSTSTGWTTTNNSGTAAITGGVARLTIASATNTGDSGPRVHCDLGAVADPWAFRVACRINAYTGVSSSNHQLRLTLQSTSAGTGESAKRMSVLCYGNGELHAKIYPVGGIGVSDIFANATAGTIAFDGDSWLIVQVLAGVLTLWRARGSGGGHTVPARTAWKLVGASSVSALIAASAMSNASPPVVGGTQSTLPAWDRLVFETMTFDTSATAVTAEIDDVSIVDLGV